MSNKRRTTPFTNPSIFPNSGSSKFSGQQAAIYKINFFNQQNDIDFANYRNSLNYNPVNPIDPLVPTYPTFPNQEKVDTPYFIYRRYTY